MTTAPAALHFGEFRLDVGESRLVRDGMPVALRPKAFDLLVALATRPNELVTKDELLDRVWGRRFITEGVIKSIVGELRGVLGDDARQPRWIETVPRRGYRFVGTIVERPRDAVAPAPPDATPALGVRNDGNVPPSISEPIGRADALTQIQALHDTHRLVTICGPSGVGKTRLALALGAARRTTVRDGVWFVELASTAAGATDVSMICTAIAQAMRLDVAMTRDVDALTTALRPLEILLVLDNAEHVLHPVAQVVVALLAGTTALDIVVTTQEPLRIVDEWVYRLSPLALPDFSDDLDEERLMASGAVRLFVERVSARLQGFTLAPQQQRMVAAICRALDGLPLALELAAARVPLLGVHGLADLLLDGASDGRLELLTGGARTAAPRQRTLRTAIEWSHALLDVVQQRVFRRLGVFAGGFSVATAQAVCRDEHADDWMVLDCLDALVDKSLIESVPIDGRPRFRLLESLRAFALERLVASDERTATEDRHLAAMRAYWSVAGARAPSEPALAWTEQHQVEFENLRIALRHADARADRDALVELLADSALLWCRLGLAAEGRTWCEHARARVDTEGSPSDHLDLAIATLSLYGGAYPSDEGLACALRAADGFEARGAAERAYVAVYLAFQSSVRGQLPFDRTAAFARMGRLERPEWSEVLRRLLRSARGYELRLSGDSAGYLAYSRRELALCRAIGAVSEGWLAAQGLMLAEQDLQHADQAIAIAQEVIDEIRARGRLRQQPVLLALWATMLAERGHAERTRAALIEALPVLEGASSLWMAHVALAWLCTHEGRDADAVAVLGLHAALRESGRATGSGAYITRSLDALARRLQKRLGAANFARAYEGGRSRDDADARRIALV